MERRFADRVKELLQDAQVDPKDWMLVVDQLREFARPFAQALTEPAQQKHLVEYTAGLLSNLKHKTGEGIAYLHGCDRKQIQQFIGEAPWDHEPLVTQLVEQVAGQLGEADAVLALDPSAFAKKGEMSVGVARQWSGRLGKIDNCQVAIYMAYVSSREHALVDYRLYLPEEWTKDRARCDAAGVPRNVTFRTRHELALEMLDKHGSKLPHEWVTGDDELGRPAWFRQELRQRNENYLLAVPSNTIIRDAQWQAPMRTGRGRPRVAPQQTVADFRESLPESAWTSIALRDAEQGPLVIELTKRRVLTRNGSRRPDTEEVLFITRERQSDGSFKHDYYLSNASVQTELADFGRAANAHHRIEHCIQRGKSEAGLADYQVRNWLGWHHHQVLSLLAAWFLNGAMRRGKNTDTGTDSPSSAGADCSGDRGATASEHLAA
jgi:SRSO17 transposase